MAGHAQTRIDGCTLASVRLAQRPPERGGRVGDEDEVHVVGHQTISPASHAMFAPLFGEQMFVEFVVVVPKEDLITAVAALSDMMRNTGNDEARDPGHGGVSFQKCPTNWGFSKVSP